MRILVTGGTGYIGSHTAVELLDFGHEVVILDNLLNSDISVIDKIQKITGKKPEFFKADVCDKNALTQLFNKYRFDWVIHFAGLKAVGESCQIPLEYYKTNVFGTINLIEVMNEFKVRNIIFSSSATVYGVPQYLPYDENHPLKPFSPYGHSKLMVEQILQDAANANPQLNAVILRYFNPVGAHSSGLIGENPKGIPNNLTPYIARVATGEFQNVKVFGNDYPTKDGTGVRDYIHVVDLAKGHVAAINNSKNKGMKIYNLGTGKGYSVLEVIKAFEKACEFKIPYIVAPRRDGDIAEFYANPSKANSELNWHATLDILDMCQSIWNNCRCKQS